jgi:glycosyltransferase involved in cell wall biosynthesis
MRILILTHSFYPNWGGTESYVSSLAKFLSRQNTSVTVYTYGDSSKTCDSEFQFNILRNRFLSTSADPGFKYHLIFGIQQAADIYCLNKIKKKFDLMHVQGLTRGFEPSFRKIELGIRFNGWKYVKGKPTVITFHEQINNNKISRYIDDAKNCNAIICNNKESALLLSNAMGKQVFYLPNGVDLEIFNPDLYKENQKNKPFTVLCPSRLVEAKGILDLVKAADILVNEQKLHNLQFLLMDGGNFNPGYQDTAFVSQLKEEILYLHLEKFFNFLNGRPYYLMPQLYSQSDITVLPSYTEGFGLPVIEAMAMKQPVIATSVGDIPKIILDGQDGLTVPTHNPAKLADSIMLLYSDSKMSRKLGVAGRAKVQDRYDLSKISRKVRAIYESVLA